MLSSEDDTICKEQLTKYSRLLGKCATTAIGVHDHIVSDYIQEMYEQLSKLSNEDIVGHMRVKECYYVLDILYSNPKFRGGLKNGGQLLAAGIVATTYIIFVPQKIIKYLPVFTWIGDIIRTPTNVIRAQAITLLGDIF